MTKRLQELPQISLPTINDWVLLKQNNGASDVDSKITYQDFINNLVQTSDVGVGVGQIPALISGTGGSALPSISGENLTNLSSGLPNGNFTTRGLLRLTDSTSSSQNTESGYAATPDAVRRTWNLANGAVKRSGDRMSGSLELANNTALAGVSSGVGISPAGTVIDLVKLDDDDDLLIGDPQARTGLFTSTAQDLWVVTALNDPAKQYRVFNEGFMGIGSGLDAQKLGGNEYTDFPRLSTNSAITGNWTFKGGLVAESSSVIHKDSATLVFRARTQSGSSLSSWISFQDKDSVENAYLGYCSSNNTFMDLTNTLGDIRLVPAASGFVRISENLLVTGTINGTTISDRTQKNSVKVIAKASEKVCKLSGNSFLYNDTKSNPSGLQYGLIAQEVEEIMPELVTTNDKGVKGIKTGGLELVGLLVQAHKEQDARIERLEALVNKLLGE